MSASVLSGRRFILGFAALIAVVAVLGYLTLRRASDRRFAISIHNQPESPLAEAVLLGRPLQVRIDKRSAGRSPLAAQALLLDGNGLLVADLRPLVVEELPGGKRAESVLFPPLSTPPGQRLLAAVVVRLPPAAVESTSGELRQLVGDAAGQPAEGRLPRLFGRIRSLSRSLGGHAELAQIEVREKP